MKISYKQRFILALSGYTFLLIFFVLSGFWLSLEKLEDTYDNEINLPTHSEMLLALKEHETTQNIVKRGSFEIYSPTTEFPIEFGNYKDFGAYQLEDNKLLVIGQHAQTREKYYLLLGSPQEKSFWEEELDDIIFVFSATIFNTIFAVFLVTYIAKKLTLPVVELQERVRNIDIESKNLPILNRDDEVGQLSKHFSDLIIKMREYSQRESDFTRFSSHELRTPITIIRGNLDLLSKTLSSSDINTRIVKRMENATSRMNNLIEVFLWLGRENKEDETYLSTPITNQSLEILVNQVIEPLAEHEKSAIKVEYNNFSCQLKPLMLIVIMENLIRNSLRHGDGDISIKANSNVITITNNSLKSNVPIKKNIGLQIVERICTANQWRLLYGFKDNDFSVSVTFKKS